MNYINLGDNEQAEVYFWDNNNGILKDLNTMHGKKHQMK